MAEQIEQRAKNREHYIQAEYLRLVNIVKDQKDMIGIDNCLAALEENGMKQITVILIVLLLAIAYSYAGTTPAEEAEHREKVRQMDQLAERFKAETGFMGEVMHSTTTMRLHVYRGNFSGITCTADGDTIAFRQACEGIITKILPYSKASRGQLYLSRISKSGRGYTTDYYQQVNGYKVEGAGWIMITFDDGRKYFSISDNTVVLPDPDAKPSLSYEDAVKIYDEHVQDDETTKSFRRRRPFLTLFYGNIYNDWEGDKRSEYRLCWVGGFTSCIYIDAQTGQVYKMVNKTKC